MVALPSDAEIRTRAIADGLIGEGADLPVDVRRRLAKRMLDEAQRPPEPEPEAGPPPRLLSSATHDVPRGSIVVDVTVMPDPNQKEATHG